MIWYYQKSWQNVGKLSEQFFIFMNNINFSTWSKQFAAHSHVEEKMNVCTVRTDEHAIIVGRVKTGLKN